MRAEGPVLTLGSSEFGNCQGVREPQEQAGEDREADHDRGDHREGQVQHQSRGGGGRHDEADPEGAKSTQHRVRDVPPGRNHDRRQQGRKAQCEPDGRRRYAALLEDYRYERGDGRSRAADHSVDRAQRPGGAIPVSAALGARLGG